MSSTVAGSVTESSILKDSRVAGIWYAVLTVLSVFGVLYADSTFSVSGDAAATASRILANEWMYRLGIASNLAGQACFVFVGLAFYKLFQSVDKNQARSLLALVVASVPVAFLNMLNKFAPIILLGDSSFLKAFAPAQLQALAMMFIELQKYGTLIVGVFWGLWLLPLGLLVYKSRFFPRILGVLLLVNGASYILDSFMGLLFPGVRAAIAPAISALLAIGEIPFLLWLLARGARIPASKLQSTMEEQS
jgi:hypothetical protein